jgi:hypothetical protein
VAPTLPAKDDGQVHAQLGRGPPKMKATETSSILASGSRRLQTQRAKCATSATPLETVCAAYLRSVKRHLNPTA